MNNELNNITTISNSFYSSLLLFAIYKYISNQTTITATKDSDKDLFSNNYFNLSSAFTEVSIPGYFANLCKKKATNKYFNLHGVYPDFKKSDIFFSKIDFLLSNPENASKIYFSEDSVKVITKFKNNKFSINYDYGYEDSLFVIHDDGNKMIIKECSISNIYNTLESYFELSERIETAA